MENSKMYYCPCCAKTGANVHLERSRWTKVDVFNAGYLDCGQYDYEDGILTCIVCGSTDLVDTLITFDDYIAIAYASNWNRELLEAMIELRKKDLIEYELKMSQFRIQGKLAEELEKKKQEEEGRKPKPAQPGLTFWWGHWF